MAAFPLGVTLAAVEMGEPPDDRSRDCEPAHPSQYCPVYAVCFPALMGHGCLWRARDRAPTQLQSGGEFPLQTCCRCSGDQIVRQSLIVVRTSYSGHGSDVRQLWIASEDAWISTLAPARTSSAARRGERRLCKSYSRCYDPFLSRLIGIPTPMRCTDPANRQFLTSPKRDRR